MEEEKISEESPAEALYTWQALEFSRPQAKTPGWYLVVGVIWLLLVAYTIYFQEWIRLVVVAVLGVVIWLATRLQPREFRHAITAEGLVLGGKQYPFGKYRAYAIVKGAEGSKLMLIPSQPLGQGLALQLGGADVERIRTIMAEVLPEEDREEDVVDRMNQWLNL